MESLRELFIDELRDIYNAEKQILKALPKMARKATTPELKAGFNEHLEQTKGHVARLEEIFEKLEMPARGKTCAGMEGIISEGAELMGEDAEPEVMDAGLIAAAQRVEHYEIAVYGTLRTYAKMLREKEIAQLLQETLNEEGETDKKLTKLATSVVNLMAV
jgi:ferritin-like metal-binding protein YciE